MDNESQIINNTEDTKSPAFNGAYQDANFLMNIGFFTKKSPAYGFMILICLGSFIAFAVSMSMSWFVAAGVSVVVFILSLINASTISQKIKKSISADELQNLNQKMNNASSRSISAQMKATPYIIVAVIIIAILLVKFS